MIDEKKIEEAARQHMIKEYCNNGDWSFPCKTADLNYPQVFSLWVVQLTGARRRTREV